MRIGTWNLAGKWDCRHVRLMREQNCDVWLLTEVNAFATLDGYRKHTTTGLMAQQRHWAAILSRRPLIGLGDPHPASALAKVGHRLICSSVLPWRSCGNRPPWTGATHGEKTGAALDGLLKLLPQGSLIWGGDWNHALGGREYAGSLGGRAHLLAAVASLRLQVPTAKLPHRLPRLLTIDHIAVPQADIVIKKYQIMASAGGKRLSDHDAYVVETG
jgi:hypothetical protein